MALTAPPFRTPEIADFERRLRIAWEYAGRPAITYSSWWRSPYDNARVGGHPNSQHLTGLAVDIPSRRASAGTHKFIDLLGAVGLVVIDEGDHWHVQRFAVSPGRGLCCASEPVGPVPSFLDRALGFVTKPRFSLLDFLPF